MELVFGRDAHIDSCSRSIVDGCSVAICGPAGVGKTAMARAVVAGFEDRTILWTAATEAAASVALGPIASLLAVAGVERKPPVELLAEIPAAVVASVPDAIVVVDDAHLLDGLSAAVVYRLADGGVPVIVTVRTGETPPDAIDALWAGGLATRHDLDPLAPEAVGEQIASMVDGVVDPQATTRVFNLSGGVPLYVREIVLAGRSSGWLSSDGEQWRVTRGAVPSRGRLRDLIASRLRACTATEIDLLELVAVAGSIELDALRTLTDLEAIAQLEERSLVRVVEEPADAVVVVDHPIIAEVVRQDIGEVRRAMHAERLVGAMVSLGLTGPGSKDRILRAGQLSARSSKPDPDLLLRAAAIATTGHDFRTAAHLARVASANGGGVAADLAWADAATTARDFVEAEKVTKRLLADERLTSTERVSATTILARGLMWGLGRADEAEGLLRSVVVDDVEQQQLLDIELAFFLLNRGEADAPIAICGPLVDSGASPAVRLRAVATLAGGLALKPAVRTVDALVEAHMDDAVAMEEVAPRAAAELAAAQMMARYLAGHAVQTGEDAAGLVQWAEETGDPELRVVGQLFCALALQARGHVAEGIVEMDRALELLANHDAAQLSGWAHAARAHMAGVVGDLAAVDRHLAASLEPPHHAFTAWNYDRTMARVRAYAHGGDRDAAIRLAVDEAGTASALGRDAAEAALLDLASRLGHAPAADRLAELAADAEGAMIPLMSEHAAALAAGDVDRLLAVASSLEEIGEDLAAADASAGAARAALAFGRTGTSAAAARRATELLARCGAPAFARPLPVPDLVLDLTDRELQVSLLAAQGRTNKEIAQALSLSPRTVGNHLYRAYAKAGVEGRLGLAEVLRTAGHLHDPVT